VEHALYAQRGGPRRRPGRASRAAPRRKLDLTDHVLAALLQLRFHLPAVAMAPLFGADQSTVSQAIKHTRELMDQQGITITPAPARIRTPAALYDHAPTPASSSPRT
jgi:hypothetical protein